MSGVARGIRLTASLSQCSRGEVSTVMLQLHGVRAFFGTWKWNKTLMALGRAVGAATLNGGI